MMGSIGALRQAWCWRSSRELHSDPQAIETERDWTWMDFGNLKAHSQWHTSSNRATPLQSFSNSHHSLVTKHSYIWNRGDILTQTATEWKLNVYCENFFSLTSLKAAFCEIGSRGSHLIGKCSAIELQPQPFFLVWMGWELREEGVRLVGH